MKQHYSIIVFTLIFSFVSNAQLLNAEFKKEGKVPYLIGKIDKTGLEGDNYKSWFTKNYNDYVPDSETITTITSPLKNYEVIMFMGTWCGDSKRQVPKFYKILEASNFPMDQFTAVAVSRETDLYKQSPQHEEEGLNIVRVPTFIFLKNGKEVNRIIEKPIETLEKDIEKIITANNYKSNYFGIKKQSVKPKKITP